MAVRYTLRMQFGPHQDMRGIREEVLDVCRKAKADEVMFFAFAEEQNDGHDPLERIQAWIAAIRPWKRALEARGIEVSLNPWHSLLHCDRGRIMKPDQPWQPMMDWQGQAATAMVCPLDPGWRAYYAEAIRLFAAEKFRVIWIDDDIRYHNHEPLDWGGCWCPLHLAEFNRRTGLNATREDIVRNVVRSGEPHPWRETWLDLWDELQCELIASWRDIAEAAGTRLGLMSSNPETHAMEGRRWDRWWSALAQAQPNTHRPHFWGYSAEHSEVLVYGISMLQENLKVQPAEIESDPEIECFPYGPWNKPYREIVAQMALAQVFGSDRLAISLYDFMGNLPGDDPERARFLGRIKPMLGWMGEQFPRSFRSTGVGVPWHPEMSRRIHTDGRIDWRAIEVNTLGWDRWLAPFGYAYSKWSQPTVNALAGAMPWGFSDEELRTWLQRGMLLDGPAAAVLIERGFSELIGLAEPRFITQETVLYSMEESLASDFGLRPGAQMSLNADKPYKNRLLQGALRDGARLISVLRGPTQQEVGHGAFLFENALGGRVAVMPWDATAGANLCMQRFAQMSKVLAWLGHGVSTGSVQGGAWLVPQFFTDGKIWRGIVWNANADTKAAITVSPPPGMGPITSAVLCTTEGRRLDAKIAGNVVELPKRMAQWEWVVLNPGE
jgi:hypothetical protein